MDPGKLIPAPDLLPAPAGVFYFLLVFTFILHIIAANLVVGGLVMAFVRAWKIRAGRAATGWEPILGKRLPIAMAAAVNLGVAPLLFLQVIYGQFIYVSSVLMAVYWLSIFVLIIAAYYATYAHQFALAGPTPPKPWLTGAAAALLIIVGYFFTQSIIMMLNPEAWPQYFARPGGTIMTTGDHSLAPRLLHFVASSLALAGLGVALWGRWRTSKSLPFGADMLKSGLRWYAVATLVNFFIGGLYLGTIPAEVLSRAVLGDRLAVGLLVLGAMAGLGSIPAAFTRLLGLTTVCALVSVVTMVLFRYVVRVAYLEPWFTTGSLAVKAQYSPLIAFILVFIGGAALVWWMLRLAARTPERTES